VAREAEHVGMGARVAEYARTRHLIVCADIVYTPTAGAFRL
jgi:hypothetical protein